MKLQFELIIDLKGDYNLFPTNFNYGCRLRSEDILLSSTRVLQSRALGTRKVKIQKKSKFIFQQVIQLIHKYILLNTLRNIKEL